MGKLSGMVLILFGCGGLVWNWNRAQRRKQEIAAELIRLLGCWEYSLERERLRLSEFLESYVCGQEAVAEFLQALVRALARRTHRSGAALWKQILAENRGRLNPDREMWELLLSAAGVFFGTSSRESQQCAAACRRRLEEYLGREKAEYAKKQKVYAPLGMLGGVMIILLLI